MSKWEPLNPWYSMSKDKDTDFGEDNSSGISVQPDHYPNVARPGGGYPEGRGHKTDAFCNKCKDQLIDGSCLRCDWGPQNRSVPVKNFPLDPFRDDKAGIRAASVKTSMPAVRRPKDQALEAWQKKYESNPKQYKGFQLTDLIETPNNSGGLKAWSESKAKGICPECKNEVLIPILGVPYCSVCHPSKSSLKDKNIALEFYKRKYKQNPEASNNFQLTDIFETFNEDGSQRRWKDSKGRGICPECKNEVNIAMIGKPNCPNCNTSFKEKGKQNKELVNSIKPRLLRSIKNIVDVNQKLEEQGLPPKKWNTIYWLEQAGFKPNANNLKTFRKYLSDLYEENEIDFKPEWSYLTGGYDVSKDGYFYVLTSGRAFKVGITNNLEQRMQQHGRSYLDMEEYRWGPPYWESKAYSGAIPLQCESILKSWMRNDLGIPIPENTKGGDGYTETAPIESIPVELVAELANLILENGGSVPTLNQIKRAELMQKFGWQYFTGRLGQELGFVEKLEPVQPGEETNVPINQLEVTNQPLVQTFPVINENREPTPEELLAIEEENKKLNLNQMQPLSSTWKEITKHYWGSKTADYAAGDHDGWATPATNIVYDNLHDDSKVGVLWELLSLFEFEENQTMPSENGKLSIQEFIDFLLKYIVGPFNQFLITVNAGEAVQENQIDWSSLYKVIEQEAIAEQESNHNELHVGLDKNPAEFRLCPICNPPQGPVNPDAPGNTVIPPEWEEI